MTHLSPLIIWLTCFSKQDIDQYFYCILLSYLKKYCRLISLFYFYLTHSCRYDSTHVGLHRDENISVTSTEDGKLCINGAEIMVFSEKEPKLIPWSLAGTQFINFVQTKIT